MILNICDVPNVMEVLRIVNLVIQIIRIVVPIILMISAMIDLVRTITNAELNKITKPMVSKVVAAVIIFLIPTLVSVIALIAGNNGEYKHCLRIISKEEIKIAYNEFENDLVEKAEETLDINDYNNAKIYLVNIKDANKRQEYEERLAVVKEQIDIINKSKIPGGGIAGYPTETYGKCTFEQKSAGGLTYGLCVPEKYTNQSIPLIVWLHGSGERGIGFSSFRNSGLLTVVEHWDQYGLKEIPAIIVAPQLKSGSSWDVASNKAAVKTIVEEVTSQYNINTNNIALIGHSLGGSGVVAVGSHMQSFATVTILSGYTSRPPDSALEYFKKTPVRGYSESGNALSNTSAFLRNVGQSQNMFPLSCGHGGVPKVALTRDDDKDGYSDLVYWMLSQGGAGSPKVEDDGKSGKPKIDSGGSTGCTPNGKYTKCSPSRGAFGSFPYYDSEPNSTSNRNSLEMDPKWKSANFTTVSKTCSNGKSMKWTVHVKSKTIWENVQEKICQITTTGIDGIVYDKDDIIFSGPTVIRFVSNSKSISNHAYGTAIDVNYSNKYTIDGKTYQPYGRDIKQYENFIKALGDEKDARNINYVLWVKIFKPLGFNWGRYWSGASYDGMHFEIDYKNT